MGTAVADLRRFNRAYTQRIGVLDESFMGSGRPVGPSRLLFEIGTGGADLLTLRARLGLDSGYVSRMLRGLEDEGLVEVSSDPLDSRRRQVSLTRAGAEEWRRLDDRSEDAATSLLEPLSERRRDELSAALRIAERLLRAATVRFEQVPPGHPLVRVALDRYFAELDERFTDGFDPGSTDGDGLAVFAPPEGAFLLAVDDDRPVGCGGVCRIDPTTVEIKRMWVSSEVRGAGVGRRLLAALERASTELGATRVVLDTNGVLTEAIAMYESSGYEPIERYNDNPYAQRWYAKRVGRVPTLPASRPRGEDMSAMTESARQEFLAGLHVGVLAVERADGPPLNVPVWYAYEPGGDVEIMTGASSVKGRLLAAAGRAALCAQQEALPYKYVTVEGPVTIESIEDVEEARAAIEPIAIRYLGDELGRAYAADATGTDSIRVRISIERWLTVDYGT